VTLLDRAEGDLFVAKTLIGMDVTDVVVDACAYHCQQCVEKTAKFIILLEGKSYANDHRSDEYLLDLEDAEIKTLIESIALKVDTWSSTIRYHHTILSNKKAVTEIITICEQLINLAKSRMPVISSTDLSQLNGFKKL
jgi:HEPN domain-containing protein